MAEKVVKEIVIKTTAAGAAQAAAHLRQLGYEVSRLNKEASKGGKNIGAGGGIAGTVAGINKEAKAFGLTGENSVISLLRGGGGMMVIGLFTTALEGLTKEMTEHTKRIKEGWTKTESVMSMAQHVPVAGPAGHALRGLWDQWDIPSAPDVHRLLKEGVRLPRTREEEDKIQLRRKQMEENDKTWQAMTERRREFMEKSRESAQGAREEMRMAGLSGPSLDRERRQIEYEKKLRELDKEKADLHRGKRFLNQDELAEFDRNQAVQRTAAKVARDAAIAAAEQFHPSRIGIPSTSMLTGAGGQQDFARIAEVAKQQLTEQRKAREGIDKLVTQGNKITGPQLK